MVQVDWYNEYMDWTTLLILIFILLGFFLFLFIWLRKIEQKTTVSSDLLAWLQDLSKRIESNSQAVDQKLSANMAIFNNRLDNASRVIGDVQKSIGEFSEIGRSMQELQHLLRSPKLRGNIGEQVLKELLAQYFPPDSYRLQHPFSNGERVDALLKTAQCGIPIDAKFPMENFRKMMEENNKETQVGFRRDFERDVKKHVQDIARKYILTEEGTSDYALMYIPSETIYYEIINTPALFEFAGQHKVLPVSPISFYAYMKAILMSFEGQRIQKQAREILTLLQSLKKDYLKTEESFNILQKHLTNAYNQSGQVDKYFGSLGQKLSTTEILESQTVSEELPENSQV